MSGRQFRDQDGSLTVELVVLTPVLFILALTILVFGRVSEARQQVVEASRAGAQAAAVLPNAGSAERGAAATAVVGVFDRAHTCAHSQIETDVSHFYPGGYVTVTVVCQVDLSDLSVPGIPGSTTVRASATAPIDPYRSVR
jgi:Flp pilus assembly protein TadG